MNKSQRQLVEILSVVAVVISLVFVGLQLVLDRRVALAQQYSDRAEGQRADFRTFLESDAYFEVEKAMWDRGRRPSWWEDAEETRALVNNGEMSVKELHFNIIRFEMLFVGFDNLYVQNKQGLLEEREWEIYRENAKGIMAESEIGRFVFTTTGRPSLEVTRAILDEISNEDMSDGT